MLWSNFCLHYDGTEELAWARDADIYFKSILTIFAVFFLIIEGIKIVQHPIEYLQNVWNWLGLPPLVMVLINTVDEGAVDEPHSQ